MALSGFATRQPLPGGRHFVVQAGQANAIITLKMGREWIGTEAGRLGIMGRIIRLLSQRRFQEFHSRTQPLRENMTYKENKMIVTTKQLFQAAYGKYAIGAYNINNLEQTMGLFRGNMDSQAPFIIQISKGARSFTHKTMHVLPDGQGVRFPRQQHE